MKATRMPGTSPWDVPRDTILFDLDGTLIDSLPDITACVNEVRARHDLPAVDLETVHRGIGRGARELARAVLSELFDTEQELSKVHAQLVRIYDDHPVGRTKLYEGTREFLTQVGAGRKLAILTNKPLEITLRILEELELSTHFVGVRAPENSVAMKPDPRAVFELLENLEASPESSLLIGDSAPDFAAGKDAGVFTVGMRHGYYSGGTEPDFWCDSWQQLSLP